MSVPCTFTFEHHIKVWAERGPQLFARDHRSLQVVGPRIEREPEWVKGWTRAAGVVAVLD